MDLNLGNSLELKKFLLPEAQWPGTTYDAPIQAIGLGVAAAFDRHCNRKFKRNTAHVDYFTADRSHWFLAATPVESVTSIETKYTDTDGWVAAGAATNYEPQSGRLWYGADFGTAESLVRVTYSGGYWYDETDDLTGSLPAGATQLPGDVKLAWLMQCQHAWNLRDKIGMSLADKPGEASRLADYDLIPSVQKILDSYIRWQIT